MVTKFMMFDSDIRMAVIFYKHAFYDVLHSPSGQNSLLYPGQVLQQCLPLLLVSTNAIGQPLATVKGLGCGTTKHHL